MKSFNFQYSQIKIHSPDILIYFVKLKETNEYFADCRLIILKLSHSERNFNVIRRKKEERNLDFSCKINSLKFNKLKKSTRCS